MALSRQVALMPNPTEHPLTVQGGLMPIRGSITFHLERVYRLHVDLLSF